MSEGWGVLFAILLILSARSLSYAQGGHSGLSFLKLGIGARSLGMGEAAVAAATDPSATHYNPAALGLTQNTQIMIMHKEWTQGVNSQFLGASFSIEPLRLGAFLNATNVPDVEIRQRPGPAEGIFTARNAALGVSAAYAIDEQMNVGLSMKYLYEKIYIDEADGFGFDVGALYRSPWDIHFGLSLSNVGSMGKLRSESSKLPTTLRFGAARSDPLEPVDGTVTLAADVVSIIPEKNTHVHVGAEFTYKETFSARAGYISGFDPWNFTAGIGIQYGLVALDYAFVPFRLDFGTTHTFSLMIDF